MQKSDSLLKNRPRRISRLAVRCPTLGCRRAPPKNRRGCGSWMLKKGGLAFRV